MGPGSLVLTNTNGQRAIPDMFLKLMPLKSISAVSSIMQQIK
jgi:hypothetical protein